MSISPENQDTAGGRERARARGAEEIDAQRALLRIARALPPLEAAYATVRFSILRMKLLAFMDLLLPEEGRILDVGCGFGLFSAYFAQMGPGRQITGIDPNARRIAMARTVSAKLGARCTFREGDVRTTLPSGPYDAIYVLDVMHHIPPDEQLPVLAHLRELLVPGGLLLIKDITTTPHYGLKFTEWLDRAMVGLREPLTYRHHSDWREILEGMGFRVRVARVPDALPYPHVLLAAERA